MAISTGPAAPSFTAKAMLVTGRALKQPFEVPTDMTKSALAQGGATHNLIGEVSKSVTDAVAALEPRGPAKWLAPLLGKVDASLAKSTSQAQKATELFWIPFSNGANEVGHSVANPFSFAYAKRAGFEIPADPAETQQLLRDLNDSKGFPVPAAADPAPDAPAPDAPKPDAPAPDGPAPDAPAPAPQGGDGPPPAEGDVAPQSVGPTDDGGGAPTPAAAGEPAPATTADAPVETSTAPPTADAPAPDAPTGPAPQDGAPPQ